MANYTIGNLDLGIKADDKNAISSISSLIDKLKELKGSTDNINLLIKCINKLTSAFKKLGDLQLVGIVEKINTISTSIANLNGSMNALGSTKNLSSVSLSINRLANGLRVLTNIEDIGAIGPIFIRVSQSVRMFSNSINDINFNPLLNLSTAINRLGNGLSKLSTLKDIDFGNLTKTFTDFGNSLDPLLEKLYKSREELIALGEIMKSLNSRAITNAQKEVEKLNNEGSKGKNIFKRFFDYVSIRGMYKLLSSAKGLVSTLLKDSIQFTETLNKFDVSFGSLNAEATRFVNNLTYAFNTSTDSIMNYMATFNSMLKSLKGLSDTQAMELSETLTRMALDYSSLYNIQIENAMDSFRSLLAGQTRSIRNASGIDATDTTLLEYYRELGGTKSLRQLSQLEKRLLRIYAVQKQMNEAGALSDLEDTLNSSSNMLKQIKDTSQELSRWLGNIARSAFQPLIQGALTLVIVFRDIAKAFAEANNMLDEGPMRTEIPNAFDGMSESAEEAEESVNSLMGLLSFDKFESLSKNDNKDSVQDLSLITNALSNWDSNLADVSSKAKEAAKAIMDFLGYEEVVDKATGDVTFKLKDGFKVITMIKDALVSLGPVIGGIIAMKTTSKMLKYIETLKEAKKGVDDATKAHTLLNYVAGALLVASVINLITNWDKLSTGAKILNFVVIALATTFLILKNRVAIGKVLTATGAAIKTLMFNLKVAKTYVEMLGTSFDILRAKIFATSIGFAALGAAVAIFALMDKMDSQTKVLVGTLSLLAVAIMAAAFAWIAYNGAMTMGIATPLILGAVGLGIAGIKALVESANSEIKAFANGGFPTKGQMFIANEAGPELVGNIGGNTAVANNDMIVQAIENAAYRGFTRAIVQNDNQTNVNLNVSGIRGSEIARAIFNPLIEEAKRNGYNVRKA